MGTPSPAIEILFLAWREPEKHRWYVIGRLLRLADGAFEFVYTSGFREARKKGLRPLLGFPDESLRYLSRSLFPHFENRVMSRGREEFATTIARLGLKEGNGAADPFNLLALTEARRDTDGFWMFASPEIVRQGERSTYRIRFFVNGVSHVPEPSQLRAEKLSPNDPLFSMWDWQNPFDEDAIMLRTDDNHLVGWVPRYYVADLQKVRETARDAQCRVVQVNRSPAPSWQRILVEYSIRVPIHFSPMADQDFQPIPGDAGADART